MSKTRYDWLVDRQPTQTRYTGLGNVTGGIKIGMKFKPTGTAEELGAITVPLVNMPTGGTLLGSEPGIDKDDLLTKGLRFISDKLFQLVKRPVIQVPVEVCTTPFLHTDLREIFECKYCEGGSNNLLRDAMIDVSHKPSFSPGHSTEFPFCGASAFGLKFGSEMSVFTTNILHSRRIEKRVIRTDCNVDYPPVNPKNGLFRDDFRSIGFKLAMQVKNTIVFAKREGGGFNLPRQVLPVILRDIKHNFDSSIGCGKGSIPGLQINADNSLIISHRRKLFTERLNFTSLYSQRLAGTISCTLNQRGREIRNRLSDVLVRGIVAINLVKRMVLESPFGAGIKSHSVISHGFKERTQGIRRNFKFQLNCPNHTHISVLKGNKSLGGTPYNTINWRRAAFGGMVYVLGMLAIVAILYIVLSYGMWILTDLNTTIAGMTGIAVSQQRSNTLNVLLQYWYVIPIFVGIIAFIYIIKYGLESDEGGEAY